MTEDSYPLVWPVGWPRTKHRGPAPFHRVSGAGGGGVGSRLLSVSDALRRLLPELDRLGAYSVIISTNVRPTLAGLPGGSGNDADPGVAVYFSLGDRAAGDRKVLACDKWDRVADNIAAIAAHVEAIRGQQRWGVGTVAQAFAGYRALPAIRNWWEILGVAPNASADEIKRARRKLLEQHHPDRPGGDSARAAEVTEAYAQAQAAGAV